MTLRPLQPTRIVVRGVPVAPGQAVGAPVFHDELDLDIPVLALLPEDVKGEHQRLANAMRKAKRQLAEFEHSIEREVGKRDARIFSVHALLLEDPSFRKAIRERIKDQLVNAEVAVRDAVAAWSERLAGVSAGNERDPVADLRDVGRQLVRILTGQPRGTNKAVAAGSADGRKVVLVTRELLPSDAAQLDRSRLAAIVTSSGGAASHAAILARGLGIPAVTDVDTASLPARGGLWVVDGTAGSVILNPTDADVDRARQVNEDFRHQREELIEHTRGFARTADGVAIELLVNIENFEEVSADLVSDLRGVGLFRTEFLFMARRAFPSEGEQYEYYKQVLHTAQDHEVTFRTIDVGGDKPLSYFHVPPEPNPVLGWRGLRLSLQWPDMFYAQLRALLRASAHGRMRIMVPMVTMVEEFRRVRAIVEELKVDLQRRKIAFDADIPLGAMVEVPAAALAAQGLAAEADFLSIGTNDLSQYALAVDRNNARVAALYQPLHPGMVKLVRMVIDAAGRAGKPVSVCGEMAGIPESALLLLGLGLRSFSMSPYHLPIVRTLIASVSLPDAQAVAKEVLDLRTTTEIRAVLRAHSRRLAPELEAFLAPEMPNA